MVVTTPTYTGTLEDGRTITGPVAVTRLLDVAYISVLGHGILAMHHTATDAEALAKLETFGWRPSE